MKFTVENNEFTEGERTPDTFHPMRILVAQIGARRHYAIPRMLYASNLLEHFYTDICATKGWPRLLNKLPEKGRMLPPVRRLLGRVPSGLPSRKITAFTSFGILLNRRLRRCKDQGEVCQVLVDESSAFCRKVLQDGWGSANTVYTFNGAGLELLRAARAEGLFAVMEQTIAPMRLELQMMQRERDRHLGWEEGLVHGPAVAAFIEREEAEWQLAHTILCGSEFVRDGIRACGGPVEKCVVVPYGLDGSKFRREPQRDSSARPLRVLTVGAAGLRKGTPYVIDCARELQSKAVFRWVGEKGVVSRTVPSLPENMEFIGVVPRSEVSEQFKWADVFLLPSICEGSALVTYEALATGLPVICTPNTGSVVTDGVEGFVVPPSDVGAIRRALETFESDRKLLATMSENAARRAESLSLAAYEKNLVTSLKQAHRRRGDPRWP